MKLNLKSILGIVSVLLHLLGGTGIIKPPAPQVGAALTALLGSK